MQALFHDGEVVFEEVEELGLGGLALLEAVKDEFGDFDALAFAPRAANDDGDEEQGPKELNRLTELNKLNGKNLNHPVEAVYRFREVS